MAAIGGRSVFVAAMSFVGGAVACKLWGGELKDRGKVHNINVVRVDVNVGYCN